MPLNNRIVINSFEIAILEDLKITNGTLSCKILKIFNWLIRYISFSKEIYDIVSRAVKAHIRELKPTARTNKEKIEYRRIEFFYAIIKALCCALAIAGEKTNSAVHFLLCKKLKGGDVYV
ncbi:MAG: hypothetical protein IJB79_07340 [Candidatus Gastranaerophilales bacterium]|nr:hypothetical protein [Candidatus Gastranaerophilales bacterium]